MTLFHGAHTAFTMHEGQCYTDYRKAAEAFAGRRGVLATVEVPDDLTIERCAGYDHDRDHAPADDAEYRRTAAERGVDVLVYEDEDEFGRTMDCYRIVSERALEALDVLKTQEA